MIDGAGRDLATRVIEACASTFGKAGVAGVLAGCGSAGGCECGLYYEVPGSGRPLVLLHGGLQTIDLNFRPLLEALAASRQVIAVPTRVAS